MTREYMENGDDIINMVYIMNHGIFGVFQEYTTPGGGQRKLAVYQNCKLPLTSDLGLYIPGIHRKCHDLYITYDVPGVALTVAASVCVSLTLYTHTHNTRVSDCKGLMSLLWET